MRNRHKDFAMVERVLAQYYRQRQEPTDLQCRLAELYATMYAIRNELQDQHKRLEPIQGAMDMATKHGKMDAPVYLQICEDAEAIQLRIASLDDELDRICRMAQRTIRHTKRLELIKKAMSLEPDEAPTELIAIVS